MSQFMSVRGERKRGEEEEERRDRVVRHLYFFIYFLPLLLKIALSPDCTRPRFQGNGLHSQLSNTQREGVGGGEVRVG